jgi:integrase
LKIARAGADGENGFVFTNWANSTRDLADACDKAKVQVLSMHDLRHVFTGWALDDGISMLEVAKALGHRNTRQLEERYDNRDPGVLQRRAEEQAAQRRHTRHLVAIEGGKSTAAKAAS